MPILHTQQGYHYCTKTVPPLNQHYIFTLPWIYLHFTVLHHHSTKTFPPLYLWVDVPAGAGAGLAWPVPPHSLSLWPPSWLWQQGATAVRDHTLMCLSQQLMLVSFPQYPHLNCPCSAALNHLSSPLSSTIILPPVIESLSSGLIHIKRISLRMRLFLVLGKLSQK